MRTEFEQLQILNAKRWQLESDLSQLLTAREDASYTHNYTQSIRNIRRRINRIDKRLAEFAE